MFKRGGNWSSDTKCGGKRSGGFVDVNGGVSKGGALVVTYNEYPSVGSNGGRGNDGANREGYSYNNSHGYSTRKPWHKVQEAAD